VLLMRYVRHSFYRKRDRVKQVRGSSRGASGVAEGKLATLGIGLPRHAARQSRWPRH